MRNKIFFVRKTVWLFFILLFGFVCVNSQPLQADEVILDRELGIENTNLVYAGNEADISFDLVNPGEALSDIHYGVWLTKKDGEEMDWQVFEDRVDLSANETVSREISYTAPEFFSGDFSVVLKVFNSKGLVLASTDLGEIRLSGDGHYVYLESAGCRLKVVEEEKVLYPLGWGVDVATDEILLLSCPVMNKMSEVVQISPIFETYYRSVFGTKVDTVWDRKDQFLIRPGETEEIILKIDRPAEAQAYDTVISFVLANDESNKKISNSVVAHYVVQGISATIQDISLDKAFYTEGETAQISVTWSGLANDFYGARGEDLLNLGEVAFIGEIKGCSEPFTYVVDASSSDSLVVIDALINKTCANPVVSLSLTVGGQVFDEATLVSDSTNSTFVWLFLLLFVIAVIYGLINLFVRRKSGSGRGKIMMFLLLLILFGGAVNVVDAATIAGAIPDGHGYGAFFGYDFYQNDVGYMVGLSYLNSGSCSNASLTGYIDVYEDGKKVGTTKGTISPPPYSIIKNNPISFTKTTKPGSHEIRLDFYVAFMTPRLGGESNLQQCLMFCNSTDVCMNGCYDYYRKVVSKTYTYTVEEDDPYCTIEWDKEEITAPGSASITWTSSPNTVSARYMCTGPQETGIQTLPDSSFNGSATFNFAETPVGPEKCSIEVKNSTGHPYICDATLVVKPAVNKPTCDVQWTPSNIAEDGKSVLEWESTGADSATYECEGIVPSVKSGDLAPFGIDSGKADFDFAGLGTGIEECILTFSNSAGDTECEATVKVNDGLSCNLQWVPTNITAPDTVLATWSSSETAVSASYVCTGAMELSGSDIPVSGSANLSFDEEHTGEEVCIITITDANGETATCGEDSTLYIASPEDNSCANNRPVGTTPCSNDWLDVPTDGMSWTNVGNSEDNCTDGRKCEYYIISGSDNSCANNRPVGTIPCPDDWLDVPTDGMSWTNVGNSEDNCTDGRKCEYYVACVDTAWEPSPETVCAGTAFTQTSNCGNTREIEGVKVCPTCTANFNPSEVTTPGSSTLIWSSENATDIKYTCTGPVSGEADYGVIPLNSSEDNPVVFEFDYGPADREVCTFTVKDDEGETGSCATNAGAAGGGGGGGGGDEPGISITPHAPTCSLEEHDEDDIVFFGDDLLLSWVSTFAESASINLGIGEISPVEEGEKTITPYASETSDVVYKGTFTGYGGSVTCEADPVTVVIDPPEIIEGSFEVSNQKTGLKPTARWSTNNVVSCDLESDNGYSQTNICTDCSNVIDFEIDAPVTRETTYTLSCLNLAGYEDVATFTPQEYFVLTAEPTEVTVDFAGGGATAEPAIELGVVSWNGYRGDVSFDADFSDLPESPGTETTNSVTTDPEVLTFTDYYTNRVTALAEIFASYRFTGEKIIKIFGIGGGVASNEVEITVQSKKTTPIYEPI